MKEISRDLKYAVRTAREVACFLPGWPLPSLALGIGANK